MTIAVVTEKPAVARDIARVLGANKRGDGYLHGNGYVITWAFGHLVTLAQPGEMDDNWQRWRRDTLPMIPDAWPLKINEKTRAQFDTVSRIINSVKVQQVVCATDAGREGELIFRYIYQAAHCNKTVQRLWISSLTAEAIRNGFAALRPGSDFDALADAARGRSQADWLVGLNLTRAYTLAYRQQGDELYSVGRVQTPTLAMLVKRELEIRDFVPEDYLEIVAEFAAHGDFYQGTWFAGDKATQQAKRLSADGDEAEQVLLRISTGSASIASNKSEQKRLPPPFLYDLTELQRHANRLYGFSAKKTLQVAQELYEKYKLISYPRTDSRCLSTDVAKTISSVVEQIRSPYETLIKPETGTAALGKRFVNDGKITDHHAIIPTKVAADGLPLNNDESRLYDLICRRLLAAWQDDHIWSVTTVITAIESESAEQTIIDRFHSSGTVIEQPGWRALDINSNNNKNKTAEPSKLPAGLESGLAVQLNDAKAAKKTTRPPPRLVDASLLTAMETAGRAVEDKELSAAMKASGLGTPATRAEIIETLIRRDYVQRHNKALQATEKGIRLIQLVHEEAKSPAMTGQWEAKLHQIQQQQEDLAGFMTSIERFVQEVVAKVASVEPEVIVESEAIQESVAKPESVVGGEENPLPIARQSRTATEPEHLLELLQSAFSLQQFRPYQEAVCRAITEGQDVLLVMPTGAGKSLCYQLPGLARAGTTLVISPLIALMEDQVLKLQQQNIRAERIHSGRDRASSRRVCMEYLAGELDFLFIAPERFSVSGFAQMLARRKPVLIAVDEAHCISQWGHDFRPDYRMLGNYLPLLRPAPIIAMTATATPLVQDDIVTQLGISDAARHVHGFRRDNIAVEIVEVTRSQRAARVRQILSAKERRPAIVYAPTRKEADTLGVELQEDFAAAAYHAGMPGEDRDRVQMSFINSELEVIVATTAFGMGVDKADIRTVIHTGLPASLEGYYQEIGRAGRDGKPSRAVLLYSYADRRTHEFFHQRDYPEMSILEQISARLNGQPQASMNLQNALNLDPDVFETALAKLWIHGGASVDPDGNACVGHNDWQRGYTLQRDYKLAQLDQILRFAQAHECRMLHLVRHFGDQEDSGKVCGHCDVCAPDDCIATEYRDPGPAEQRSIAELISALRQRDGLTTGQLFKQLTQNLERREFERLLGALVRYGMLSISDDHFIKEGREIKFQRAFLGPAGMLNETALAKLKLPVPPDRAKSRAKKKSATITDSTTSSAELEVPEELVTVLSDWRLSEARKRKVPAFQVLSNRVLREIAAVQPADAIALLNVKGVGPKIVEKYGGQILDLVGNYKNT